ncbi:MAG: hypothetical protein HYT78_21825 [Deltaproteobacteria bacterium]|nr:hypothetical protein [Deltaproteobacteria bacterium]
MDEEKITAGLLRKVMSGISEDYWCAGWLHDLEYVLWDAVIGKRKGICSPEEVEQLKYLSEKCGGWVIWDEQVKDERFVPMKEWLRLYEARGAKVSQPDE